MVVEADITVVISDNNTLHNYNIVKTSPIMI